MSENANEATSDLAPALSEPSDPALSTPPSPIGTSPALPAPDGPPRPTPSLPIDPTPASTHGMAHPNPPRVGDLTVGWRAIVAITWLGVVVAFAAVWNASVQLGLSTWWLGPRSVPQPRIVQFAPFLVPIVMVLAAINQIKGLPRWGMLASLVVIAVGVGDLDRVTRLGVVEIAAGVSAFVVSVASTTGAYRAARAPGRPVPTSVTDRPVV